MYLIASLFISYEIYYGLLLTLHDEAFERAMVAFGLAKGLNAIISLIQGTELSVAPVGIGVAISVGQVLDPFNDMVERFSWVMLLSSISLGIQKLLLVLSTKLFLQLILAVSISFSLLFLWFKKFQNKNLFSLSLKFVILLLLLRFSAIFFVYSSEFLYTSILQTQYIESSKVIKLTQEKLQNIQDENKNLAMQKSSNGLFDKLRSQSNTLINSLDLVNKLKNLEKNIEQSSRRIITLITIFIVQTILMPLLYLYLLVASIKLLFRVELNDKKIFLFLESNKSRV